jgi:acetoin:2,6-dichlorophenolindophenol oxidoreductase subunit alpha
MEFTKEDLLKLYRNMVSARKMDETIVESFARQKEPVLGFYHSGQGEEATAVGGTTFLRKDDWVLASDRSHGTMHAMAKGMTVKRLYAEHFGRAAGCCGGWSGFHTADVELGLPGTCGCLGGTFPLTAGIGIALKKKGEDAVVVSYFGDGASGRGTLHESFNMAAVMKLPVVWVCENNEFAMFTPFAEHSASKNVADLASGYAMPSAIVDGQDVLAVAHVVMSAVERARTGAGPSLVECKTHRFRSHFEGAPNLSGFELIPEKDIATWRRRDPIVLFRKKLIKRGILTAADAEEIDKEIAAQIAQQVKEAMESRIPDPEVMFGALYSD